MRANTTYDRPAKTIEIGGLPCSVLPKARYFAGLGLHFKSRSSMYAIIAYKYWFRGYRITGAALWVGASGEPPSERVA